MNRLIDLRWILAATLVVALYAPLPADPPLPVVKPDAVGMHGDRLDRIDDVVARGIEDGEMPGAVVLIGHQGRIVFRKAYGDRQVEPQPVDMTVETVFDLASLTKPLATATSVMTLVEQGKINLDAPVAKYIPEFANNGKEAITVQQLLTHQSGLIADNSINDYEGTRDEMFQRIFELDLVAEPGERFIYSDVGFLVLGELVERVSGKRLDEYAKSTIYEPLGMSETGFLPSDDLKARAAPATQRDGEWIRGEVHDPRSYRLGGVAGHAGLFSTADDLARYAQMMLNGGEFNGARILKPETIRQMTTGYDVPGGSLRGLGWDSLSGYSSNRGELLSPWAFGHGGFTGTAMWIDPQLDLFVIFLSNRLHPDGKGNVNPLAGNIANVAASAIGRDFLDAPPTSTGVLDVWPGLDVLERDNYQQLAGKRVGLITNHTGVNREGTSAVKLLHDAENVDLQMLFSPEHGFEGKLDVSRIGDAKDETTGLKIFSLYGETRSPTAESLQEIDVLVFDIQDIGARFYTYVSTMVNAMKAAAEHDVEFVVLDRPNPIGGVEVAGPVLDAGLESFVGYHTVAVQHGMTVGELAEMIVDEMEIDVDLTVIPVEGWRRAALYDATGLRWINPSPNMRNLTQAVLYPGIGLLETTNVSVGRGTDTPFEILGAPWIDERELAAELNRAGLPGVRFVPIRFTPESSKYAGEECGGVNFLIVDRAAFESVRTGLAVAVALRKLYREDWDTKFLNRLLSDEQAYEGILAGQSVDELMENYAAELAEFQQRRRRYLKYD